MTFPKVNIDALPILSIEKFREMDYLAVNKYDLPIELMMENAGLNLARLATSILSEPNEILIGIGTGNNGGGGLVAARRLAGWGYPVYLDIPDSRLKELPSVQLKRAMTFGAKIGKPDDPRLFIDAYFGFSQRLPLPGIFEKAIEKANRLFCPKISFDLPSGFDMQTAASLFKPDIILTLAAMKAELLPKLSEKKIFVADLGIPSSIYQGFQTSIPDAFVSSAIIEVTL